MLRCGLLGEKLGHSYSPAIHAMLGDYSYDLFEKEKDEVESFLKDGAWDGLNVTIPYKKTVMPFCDELSETAQQTGSVNTLVRRKDGTIFGDNTDAPGFCDLLTRSAIPVQGKKVLVLGSGGASAAVCTALRKLQADTVVISRSGKDHYGNLARHRDAAVLVNTTPVGMYPKNLEKPLSLEAFPALLGVLDVIYNPARTALLLEAEERGIPCVNGLYMLVAQAKRSSELFTGSRIDDMVTERITKTLERSMQNIVLIGMPGCGKSTIARLLGSRLSRPVIDADRCIEERAGLTIPQIFEQGGEALFRRLETEVLTELGKASGTILSTGGGCVTRRDNYPLLHQNGTIFRIRREVAALEREGRPLSGGNLLEMQKIREPLYEQFADYSVDNNGPAQDAMEQILAILEGNER